MKAEGYAVVFDGKIDIRTVSSTRRAALVNWLVVEPLEHVTNAWTDDLIEERWRFWEKRYRDKGARLIAVTIEESLN